MTLVATIAGLWCALALAWCAGHHTGRTLERRWWQQHWDDTQAARLRETLDAANAELRRRGWPVRAVQRDPVWLHPRPGWETVQ
jgi:hypothetical protein